MAYEILGIFINPKWKYNNLWIGTNELSIFEQYFKIDRYPLNIPSDESKNHIFYQRISFILTQ